MSDALPEPAYINGLATQLEHDSSFRQATEDDLARYRHVLARVADWINNQHAIDHHTRADLAQHIGLPAPRDPRKETTQ